MIPMQSRTHVSSLAFVLLEENFLPFPARLSLHSFFFVVVVLLHLSHTSSARSFHGHPWRAVLWRLLVLEYSTPYCSEM